MTVRKTVKKKAPARKTTAAKTSGKAPAARKKVTKKAAAKKAPRKKAPGKKAAYTRNDALCDALKRGGTVKEIVSELDRIYCERTGAESSESASKTRAVNALPALEAFGVIVKGDDKRYTLAK